MERIVRGISRFRRHVYPGQRGLFETLALGQRPDALFITCSDSRIDPCLLTQTQPGELFICRVIGNVVPRYPMTVGGVSATVEYASAVLEVPDIVVCGHTDCGVMKGVLDPDAVRSLPNVTAWLAHAHPAGDEIRSAPDVLLALTERNVVAQLDNLLTHPAVASRVEAGELRLHGWVYHIGEGLVTSWDAAQRCFLPLGA